MNLSTFVLERPVTTLMALLSLVILGATAVARLPIAFMPPIAEPVVEVSAQRQGQPAWVVEETVTRPLEEELARIPGYRSIDSHTRWNRSEVELFFDWNVDVDLKKAEVREAVERVRPNLPDDVTGLTVTGDLAGPGGRAVVSGRISSGRDLSESYDLIETKILRPIERIPGVADVQLQGVDPKRVTVEIDPDAMQRHGVGVGQILPALNESNVDLSAGVLRGGGQRRPVRSIAAFQSLQEIRDVPLPNDLKLSDVAEVRLEEPPLWMGRHLNGNFAIGIDVQKEPTANTVEVVTRIEAVVDEINRDPSMEGIDFLIWHNEAEEIKKSLAGLRNAGIFGGILAVLILLGFLRRVRTTLIVAVAIPFSLITSCGFMYLLGKELNVLALLGLMLGVGMLVDNSVVVIENIHRHREMGMRRRDAARVGAGEVTLAVTAATATTLCVWLPFFLGQKSEMGIMIAEVAVAMCLTIGSSLIISLTFIPLAAARFASQTPEPPPGRILRALRAGYASLLRFTLRHRALTLTCLFLICLSIWVPFNRLEKEPSPSFQKPDIQVQLNFAGSFPKERTEAIVTQVEEKIETLREKLEFEYVYSWYGDGWGGVRVFWPVEKASEKRLEEGAAAIQGVLPRIAGVRMDVGDESWGRRRSFMMGGGNRNSFRLMLYADENAFLVEKAEELEGILSELPGVTRVRSGSWGSTDEMHIVVDREAALARELSSEDVGRTVGFWFQGRTMRRFQAEDKEIDVFLAVKGWDQEGFDRLLDLRIPTRQGETTPLAGIAEFRRTKGRHSIRRENRRTHWVLRINHEEGKREEVMALVGKRMGTVPFPEGATWEIGGQRRERADWADLLTGFALALLLVYIVMASLFESTSQPLAIIISLPLAGAGAFWLLWAVGAKFDLPAYIGCIVLLGIVVNNGIVLLDHVNLYRKKGMPYEQALLQGSEERLRPILMTAMTTVIGLGPMAMGRFTVGNVYIDTMAWAVIGGLTTSTILTLLALPTWASVMHDIAVFTRRAERTTRGEAIETETSGAAGS